MLHNVADVPMICHALTKVVERGWGPVVVVVNEQNEASIKEVLTSKKVKTIDS